MYLRMSKAHEKKQNTKTHRKKASGNCQKMWIMMAFIEIHTYIMYVSQKTT